MSPLLMERLLQPWRGRTGKKTALGVDYGWIMGEKFI
jgi:hypothetical protein